MGVRRKIVPLVRAASGRDATFEATGDYLRVVLPRRLAQPLAPGISVDAKTSDLVT